MQNENENNSSWTYPPQDSDSEPIIEILQPWEYGPEDEPKPSKKKEKKTVTFGKLIVVALCCSLLGGTIGVIGGLITLKVKDTVSGSGNKNTSSQTTIVEGERENVVIDITKVDTNKVMTPAEVYATNVNSTVGITTSIKTTNLWGYQTAAAASGSGFIISEDGYILTNYHVIEDSDSISVSFYSGNTAEAELIGYDASNDIAVLKVNAKGLTPVTLGDSSNMNVGDTVMAIGNPLGELTFSLTVGAVSALDREVTTSNGITMNLMQTDCAINSGNSGGGLFNLYGEVIGITNAKYSSNSTSEASIDNIGFAIPVNHIRDIVKNIIEKGYISKPYIGVSAGDVSEESQSYGLPKGASIKNVVEGSPAEKAGLQLNDIITHINGTAINGSSDLISVINEAQIGDVLKLTVYRQGETLELQLTVGEQVQSATQEKEQTQTEQNPSSVLPGFPFWGFDGFGY